MSACELFSSKMPVSDYTVENPLKKVQQLFDSNPELTHEDVKKVYEEYFSDPEHFKRIYTLNRKSLSYLQSGKLVHMRCMVQDMYNPEYFVPKYQTTNRNISTPRQHTALYSDSLPQQSDEEVSWCGDVGHQERQVFYCTPVPAETPWFRDVEGRRFCGVFETPCQSLRPSNKRKMDDDDDDDVEMGDDDDGGFSAGKEGDVGGVDKVDKKQKTNNQKEDCHTDHYRDNFPLSHETDIPAVVKVYDADADLQLNDVIEVVGVITLHSSLQCGGMDGGEEEEAWMSDPHPIHVPRIHAILLRKQPPLHPLTSSAGGLMAGVRMQACRERLLSLMTSLLLGDHTAAVCLLCHLLSSVYVRHDVTPLGKLSINLFNLPQPSTHSHLLTNLIHKLVTKCHVFDMTLENMNKCRLVPNKDHTHNRLNSGILQLSKGTQLIIDETKLMPGKLDHNGIRNLAALSDALQWQRINYDFHYHTIPFDTDIRFLVLSHAKSLLKTDLSIMIQPSPPPSSSSSSSSLSSSSWQHQYELLERVMSEEWWMELRWYLLSAQQVVFSIRDDVQKFLEEEFVKGRREEDMSTEQMHCLLTLARYVSMSEGIGSLEEGHWRTAKSMLKDLQARKART